MIKYFREEVLDLQSDSHSFKIRSVGNVSLLNYLVILRRCVDRRDE